MSKHIGQIPRFIQPLPPQVDEDDNKTRGNPNTGKSASTTGSKSSLQNRRKLDQDPSRVPIVDGDEESVQHAQEQLGTSGGLRSSKRTAAEEELLALGGAGFETPLQKKKRLAQLQGLADAPIPLPVEEIDTDLADAGSFDLVEAFLSEQQLAMQHGAEAIDASMALQNMLSNAVAKLSPETLAALAEPEEQTTTSDSVAHLVTQLFPHPGSLPMEQEGVWRCVLSMLVAGIPMGEEDLNHPQIMKNIKTMLKKASKSVSSAQQGMLSIDKQRSFHQTFIK